MGIAWGVAAAGFIALIGIASTFGSQLSHFMTALIVTTSILGGVGVAALIAKQNLEEIRRQHVPSSLANRSFTQFGITSPRLQRTGRSYSTDARIGQ